MDLSVFDDKYHNDQSTRSVYDPKSLLKVILLACSRGLISSRKIEQACRKNIIFMALACGQYQNHITIAAFVSSMKGQILPLFRDVLLVCKEQKLLGGTFFAVDGCKLPSNASKEWSGKISDLKRKKDKIERKVQRLLNEQIGTDNSKSNEPPDQSNYEKQIEKLKQQAERIEKWLNQNGPQIGANGKEIQSNIADNESAKMHTSHGTIQGYNGQALVDKKHQAKDQYICPDGQPLKLNVKKAVRDRIIYRRYVSNVETCQACALKGRCIRRKNGKRKNLIVPIGYTKDNYSKAMAEKVDSVIGRRIYPQRIAIVEPVLLDQTVACFGKMKD